MKFINFFKILFLKDTQDNYFILTSLLQTCLLVLSSSVISIFLGLGLGIILYLNHYKKNLLQKVVYITLIGIVHFLTSLPFVFFSFFMLFVVLSPLINNIQEHKILVSYVCLIIFLTLIFAKKCEQILIKNGLELKSNKKNNQKKLKFFSKTQYEILSKINLLINSGFVYSVIISGYLEDKKIGHLFYTVLKSCIKNDGTAFLNDSLKNISITLHSSFGDWNNKTFLFNLFWLIVLVTQSIFWSLYYLIRKKNCKIIRFLSVKDNDNIQLDF
ncbi:hypothetical protein C6B37_01045 [Candidatus Phytoplasma phoenicium]|uniref:Uncharacterized protein n=1 Tax=Candidatus Phytoplasma phoenicium TaxID=198422 RepID=A0A2S8NV62_9MOLU|nr:hypothetical protein C6B37_01045 [Candidatus Phytoplasma phoenicium]